MVTIEMQRQEKGMSKCPKCPEGTIRCHSNPDGEEEGRPWVCDNCGYDVS